MKSYGVNELREMYLDFFEKKDHLRANSFPLIPKNDNSLLLINSGMAPLKAYFTGQETPPNKRMTTCQKCIRTGDIENVGKTSRHGTFFEMLGNFSFGDYFKKEAIAWAWEFFTEVLDIPTDKLYVSVYEDDDEAADIWHHQEKVPAERIVRLGKADNFWEHGTGPCGPCSEIYVDRGEAFGCDSPTCGVGCDCDRYVEVWNLVFTQFEKTDDGRYLPLEFPNIDTGMGLERLAVMMQGVDSIFDVDTIKALRDEVCSLSKVVYNKDHAKDVSIRLVTDHIRSVTFMTSDGILPSNEGRGYVLRRLLRRAARHGKLLGIKGAFLAKLVKVVIETSKDAYPELSEKEHYIYKIISIEEERFAETIDAGLNILKKYIEELIDSGSKTLSGEHAFKLYDTYGFPIDLTLEILEEQGMNVDEAAFKDAMEAQRQRARDAREESNYMGQKESIYNQLPADLDTTFVGYSQPEYQSVITAITTDDEIVDRVSEGQKVSMFVQATPFYATSGGQMNDTGYIFSETGEMIVEDVAKVNGNKWAHIGKVVKGTFSVGEEVNLIIDKKRRHATMKNHSATHLLQRALKNVLGEHVEQAGSSVSSDRLRFDFTHFSSMTPDEIEKVELEVNEKIQEELPVIIKEMNIEEAKSEGAMALFGEKYGDRVRVVKMGDYSTELCGGTHLNNTLEAGVFKIVSEGGVAAGVRRIEALTSEAAIQYYRDQEALLQSVSSKVKADTQNLLAKLDSMLEDQKALQQELDKLKAVVAKGAADDIMSQVKEVGDVKYIAAFIQDSNPNSLRDMGDSLKQKLKQSVVVLMTSGEGKVNIVAMASDDAVAKGAHAGNLVKAAAAVVGGGGGGRPTMAQAGGKDPSKIEAALAKAEETILEQLNS